MKPGSLFSVEDDLSYQDLEAALNSIPIETDFHLLDVPVGERMHTYICGSTGDGKSQCQIALMVSDIARGAEVWWLNPHLALYNEKDQPTDLRPLQHHFHQVYDYEDIKRIIVTLRKHIYNKRMPLYRENKPYGHDIVLYLDEWPGIVDVCGSEVADAIGHIIREGRKVGIFVNLAAISAQVQSTGLPTDIRRNFLTKLVGNVERDTWTALVGKGTEQVGMTKKSGKWWYVRDIEEKKKVEVELPSAHRIAAIASKPVKQFPPLDERGMTEDHKRALEILKINPAIGQNELARQVYGVERGGGSFSQKAKGLRADLVRWFGDDFGGGTPHQTEVEQVLSE